MGYIKLQSSSSPASTWHRSWCTSNESSSGLGTSSGYMSTSPLELRIYNMYLCTLSRGILYQSSPDSTNTTSLGPRRLVYQIMNSLQTPGSRAPWYYDTSTGPTLGVHIWYQLGPSRGYISTVYRLYILQAVSTGHVIYQINPPGTSLYQPSY